VREAANRAKCNNNLRQMGLAFHNHQVSLGAFPSGGDRYFSARTLVDGTPATIPQQAWGWGYQIMAYVEQDNLWRGPSAAVVRRSYLLLFTSPSRRPPVIRLGTIALADYAGNGGDTTEYAATHTGPLIRFDAGRMTLSRISDGSSNTLLVGEKYVSSNLYL